MFLVPRIWPHSPRSTSGRPPVRTGRAARAASSCKPGHLYQYQPISATRPISRSASQPIIPNSPHLTSRGWTGSANSNQLHPSYLTRVHSRHLMSDLLLDIILTILIDGELIDWRPKMSQ